MELKALDNVTSKVSSSSATKSPKTSIVTTEVVAPISKDAVPEALEKSEPFAGVTPEPAAK